MNSTHVMCDVLARSAITTCGCALKATRVVKQANGYPIQLGLAGKLQLHLGLLEPIQYAPVESQHIVLVKGIFERQHRHFMNDLRELLERLSTDALRGRIVCLGFGVLFFKTQQALHRPVVLGVRHRWLVQHVILMIPGIQLLPKRL